MTTRSGLAALLVGAAALLSACGGSAGAHPAGPPGPSSWRQLATAEAARATSEFGRSVLRDEVVTRAEYEESVRRVVGCGRAKGYAFQPTLRYGLYEFAVRGTGGDTAYQQCTAGDLSTVQSIYNGQYTDPDSRGVVVIYECLARSRVLPAGWPFDAETFQDDIDTLVRSAPESGRLFQAYDRCSADPLGHSS